MASDQQTEATRFDPATQFSVSEIEKVDRRGLVVSGRCWFGPIIVGTVFGRVAALVDDKWEVAGPSSLEVESIGIFDQFWSAIEQTWSARLWLAGVSEHLSSPGDRHEQLLLVGDAAAGLRWERDGQLWRLGEQPTDPGAVQAPITGVGNPL